VGHGQHIEQRVGVVFHRRVDRPVLSLGCREGRRAAGSTSRVASSPKNSVPLCMVLAASSVLLCAGTAEPRPHARC